jgi:tRNA(fMet)-specific endonuclease VapC
LQVILDTNALSAVAEAEPGAASAIAAAALVAIPVIVLGERWLERNLGACRVLHIDDETASRYAEVRLELKRTGTPIPANDAWIAAFAASTASLS